MPGKKLLVADDSLTIQKVIRLALSNEGYEIQAISDGAEAIQQISTFRPDAVLIDVSLPTRTAFEIKREVNGMHDHAATRFILMSSAFEKIDEAQAEEVGFDGHLTKPFDPAHLRQTLAEVLAAPPTPPASTPEMIPPPEPTSAGIQLDPPSDFPPSDFEIVEPTRTQAFQAATPPPLPIELPPDIPTVGPASGEDEDEDELWGRHEEPTPPPPPSQPITSESDEIRELTESTIRMSGLADLPQNESDFEWKVNEPSLKPPGSLADTGDSNFSMPNFAPLTEKTESSEQPPLPPNGIPTGMNAMPSGMEDLIRIQIQQTLEKMAREILPEVAERVIKAEINKLLNEKL